MLCADLLAVEIVMQKRLPQWTVPFVWVAATLASAYGSSAQGQVISAPDGTGTTVDQQGDRYDISGGTQAGANLFHSFEELSIQTNETANFISGSDVFNIVGRVSGQKPSYIDGQVQVSGSDANLYLVNPSGIMFGPDAQLSLQGSFTATTADQVGFDDAWLDVFDSGTTDYSGLSADPSAFRFTANAASAVVNQGDLAVNEGESLSLIGGNALNTGSLKAPGGEIGLVAVGGQSTVRFGIPGSLLSLEVAEGDVPVGVGGGFSATALPALLTGSPGSLASSLVVNPDGSVFLGGVNTEAAEVGVSGEVSTRSAVADGGAIALLGNTVDLVDNAVVDASGVNGGTVLVGRGFTGQENLPISTAVWSDTTVAIRADGLAGSGGNVFFGASERAYARGSISAQGATQGGFVETSADLIEISGSVNASGQTDGGQWLIDPVDIEIVGGAVGLNQIDPTVIESALDAGTDVSITTTVGTGGSGDIALSSSINQLGGRAANLTLTGRRFSRNNSTINLTSTGQLTFELNQVNPEAVTSSSSIASAIASIGNVNGNRLISLGAGTYDFSGPVSIDTQVEIEGAGAATTRLRDISGNRVFDVLSGGDAFLHDLTFTATAIGGLGGGIRSLGGALNIADSRFMGNRAAQGGALFLNNATATVVDSVFENNVAASKGGGIYARNGSRLTLDTTDFIENVAGSDGGGINVENASVATISDSSFVNNSAGDDGGGVYTSEDTTLTLANSRINRNHSDDMGGGLYASLDTITNITATLFDGNVSSTQGGGAAIRTGAIANIAGSTFINNEAIRAGGLLVSQGAQATVNGTVLANNTASENGGAIAVEDTAALTLNGSSALDRNRAVLAGGGLYAENAAALNIVDSVVINNNAGSSGGGAYIRNSGVLTIDSSDFNNNVSVQNGGGLLLDNQTATVSNDSYFLGNSAVSGGGIYASSSDLTLAQSIFSNNQASRLGGGLFQDSNTLNISQSRFQNNQSALDGGGILLAGNVVTAMDNSTVFFANHAAANGGGLATTSTGSLDISQSLWAENNAGLLGGGLYKNTLGDVSIATSTFQDKSSDRDGGDLNLWGGGTTVIRNSTLTGNEAVADGGALVVNGGSAVLTGMTINSNRAGDTGGGLYQENSGDLSVSSSSLSGNRAGNEGGGDRK